MLAAYRAYFATTVRLAERPNPADPALDLVTVDPQRAQLRASVQAWARQRISRRGPLVAAAAIRALAGIDATVLGCVLRSGQRLYLASGAPAGGAGPGPAATIAQLRWDSGRWRVARTAPAPLSACR